MILCFMATNSDNNSVRHCGYAETEEKKGRARKLPKTVFHNKLKKREGRSVVI